jgi:O-antigen/teichoic acid export membrane protein
LLISAGALALFGLIRFVFNTVGLPVFGPEFIGQIGTRISAITIVAIVIASVPSVLGTKFVAEFRGAGDPARAGRLFSGVLIATTVAGALAAVSIAVLDRPSGASILASYAPLYGLYVVFKGSYFAFSMQRRYARSEIVGASAFALTFGVACFRHNPALATASLLAHPAVFVALAVNDHHAYIRVGGGLRELAHEWRRYGLYSIATFVNALNGLGSYHLLVVIAAYYLDPVNLGFLNVVLAALAPLNLVPTAYGSAAFPEMSRRYGAGDSSGLRALLRRSTIVLQGFAVLASAVTLIAPARVLTLLHLPHSSALIVTWCCITLSLELNMSSAPAGHFFNATRYVGRHAVLSGVFLIAGTTVGLAAMGAWGIAGAGVMRLALDGPLAWTRMVVAERWTGWVGGPRGVLGVLVGQAAMLGLFAAAIAEVSVGLMLMLWVVAMLVQIPGLAEAVRRPS